MKCEARSIATDELCGAYAVCVLVIACVHEHVIERAACGWHRMEALRREIICRACGQAKTSGHVCVLTALAEVDEHGNRHPIPLTT